VAKLPDPPDRATLRRLDPPSQVLAAGLLDLTGEFATRMGASPASHSGPRDRARRWAVALDDAYALDGLRNLSSTRPGATAVVLDERARDALPVLPAFNRALSDAILTDVIDACAARLAYLRA
jgi:hypothetical protein